MESETKILLSIESLNIFHSTSKKELAPKIHYEYDINVVFYKNKKEASLSR